MIGSKLAPVCLASALPFLDIIDEPGSTGTSPCLYNIGDVLYLRDSAGVSRPVGTASGLTGILGLAHGGTGADLSAATANASTVLLTNKVANGGSAVAFAVNNAIDLANAAAEIFEFRSNNVAKAAIRGNGSALIAGAELTSAAPAPVTVAKVSIGTSTNTQGGACGVGAKAYGGQQVGLTNSATSTTSSTDVDVFTIKQLANNGTYDYDNGGKGGFVTVCTLGAGGPIGGTVYFGTDAVCTLGGLAPTNLTVTLTTANNLNVGASGGKVRFENKTGGTIDILCSATLGLAA
jgi:hypothetical protein